MTARKTQTLRNLTPEGGLTVDAARPLDLDTRKRLEGEDGDTRANRVRAALGDWATAAAMASEWRARFADLRTARLLPPSADDVFTFEDADSDEEWETVLPRLRVRPTSSLVEARREVVSVAGRVLREVSRFDLSRKACLVVEYSDGTVFFQD